MSSPFFQFARGASAVFVLSAIGLVAAYTVSETIAPVYPDAHERASIFASSAEQIIAASFGNSHNRAIDFDVLGMSGFHFWWPGGDIFEAVRAIEESAQRAPNLSYAFVTVSPFVLDNSRVADLTSGRAHLRRKTYVEHGNYRPISDDWKVAFHAAISPIARPDNWLPIARAILKRSVDSEPKVSSSGFPLVEDSTHVTAGDVITSAEARSESQVALESESIENRPDFCNEVESAYNNIAMIGRKAHLRVIFYTPPYTTLYANNIEADGNRCRTGEIAKNIAAEWDNVIYLDYSRRTIISHNLAYFLDADHLNAGGAAAFSRHLKRDLENQVYLLSPNLLP